MKEKLKNNTIIIKYFMKSIKLMWDASKFYMLWIFVINIIIGAVSPATLWVWKGIIDSITNILKSGVTNFTPILYLLGIHLAITISNSLISNIGEFIEDSFNENLEKYISEKMINKVLRFDMDVFDNHELYNDIQKANQQSLTRCTSILQLLLTLTRTLTSLSGTIYLLIGIKSYLVLITILSTFPLFYISCRMLEKWFNIFDTRFETNRHLNYLKSLIIKNENIKEIKTYNSGDYILNIILSTYTKFFKENRVIRKKFILEKTLLELLDYTLTYSVKLILIVSSLKAKATIGTITMYISSIDSIKNSLSTILSSVSTGYENVIYLESLFKILEIDIEDEKDRIDLTNEIYSIEFKDVYFKYPHSDNLSLQNINLTMKKNTTYAIVGINGSGKTTLIKLLIGLYQPTSGKILINGIDIKKLNKSSILKHISAIFQDFIKYPFDIKTNIGIGDINNIDNLSKIISAAHDSEVGEYIESLPNKYDTQLQKEWADSTELSLGQWQKIAIARSLMKESSMLILDEPTSSLDIISEYEIFNRLKTVKADKLCILVTHRLTNISLADEIIVIEDGSILEQGNHNELIDLKGKYYELYSIQSKYYNQEYEAYT